MPRFLKSTINFDPDFDIDVSGDTLPQPLGFVIHGSSSDLPCLRGSNDGPREGAVWT